MEIFLSGGKGAFGEDTDSLRKRKAWKAGLIDVLKNSPSKDRKSLRWNLTKVYLQPADGRYGRHIREVAETKESEVLHVSSP